MIFDVRTYTCKPATIKQHLALYEEHGLAPQTKNLGQPIVYGHTEIGDVNTYIHIWVYDDIADRAKKREALWSDPDWLAYTKKSAELGALIKQENTILNAVPFYKMPGST
ncbi:MAG: NIPSNAP family protein, partial [Pseudomonadota bacterium]